MLPSNQEMQLSLALKDKEEELTSAHTTRSCRKKRRAEKRHSARLLDRKNPTPSKEPIRVMQPYIMLHSSIADNSPFNSPLCSSTP